MKTWLSKRLKLFNWISYVKWSADEQQHPWRKRAHARDFPRTGIPVHPVYWGNDKCFRRFYHSDWPHVGRGCVGSCVNSSPVETVREPKTRARKRSRSKDQRFFYLEFRFFFYLKKNVDSTWKITVHTVYTISNDNNLQTTDSTRGGNNTHLWHILALLSYQVLSFQIAAPVPFEVTGKCLSLTR